MFKKIFSKEKQHPADILRKLNISRPNAHYFTEYKHLESILQENNNQAPPLKQFIKEMKRDNFNPSYLLKCAVVAHYGFQHKSQANYFIL